MNFRYTVKQILKHTIRHVNKIFVEKRVETLVLRVARFHINLEIFHVSDRIKINHSIRDQSSVYDFDRI